MTEQVVQYVIGVGVAGALALLWKIDRAVTKQNGSLTRVAEDLAEHKANDREDFRRLYDKIDELRAG